MGTGDQVLLHPRQSHSLHSVQGKFDPYWREMMQARNTMGHLPDQQHLFKQTHTQKKRFVSEKKISFGFLFNTKWTTVVL